MKNKLTENPEVQIKIDNAVVIAEKKKKTKPTLNSVRELLSIKEVSTIFEDILATSSISEPFKKYLKGVFIDKKSRRIAIQSAFGRDIAYKEEKISEGIMNNPAVKDFLELIKLFYIRVAPVAALKEVELMMSNNPKVALEAAKDIRAAAGIGDSPDKGSDLPVRVIINMGGANPTQVINEAPVGENAV